MKKLSLATGLLVIYLTTQFATYKQTCNSFDDLHLEIHEKRYESEVDMYKLLTAQNMIRDSDFSFIDESFRDMSSESPVTRKLLKEAMRDYPITPEISEKLNEGALEDTNDLISRHAERIIDSPSSWLQPGRRFAAKKYVTEYITE